MAAKGLWLAALLVWSSAAEVRQVPWTFRADFHHGFTGWMSYPLPQDIGFDPTLLVEQGPSGPTLIRQVVSVGESRVSAGFIRPLHFLANAGTRVHLRYTTTWPSAGASLKLLLAGEDGRRYETALPASGDHEITIGGEKLKLPDTVVAIEAIVMMGSAAQHAKGDTNRIELREFQVDALRPAQVSLVRPALLADPDRSRVAAQIVDPAAGLLLELGAGTFPVQVALKDGAGRTAVNRALAAPGRHVIPLGADARPGLWTASLKTANAQSDFSFLVLPAIPVHPRVLLSSERLAQLRSGAEFAALRKQIHEQARAQSAKLKDAADAGAEIAGLPAGRTLRPSYDGELTSYPQLIEGYSSAIALGALDYTLAGDTASLEAARRELLAVARWSTWTPNQFASHGMHTYYETGIFGQRLAFAYDLIASSLSPEEKRQVEEAFWTKCIEPTVEEYFLYNRMPTAASNWMANSLGGALAAAVAVAGDVPDWRDREGVALAQLIAAYEWNLRGLFPGDGSEREPAGYHHFAMEGLSWGAAALRGLHIQPAGMADMLEGFWAPNYAMVSPSLMLDTGDFHGEYLSLAGFAFGAEFGGIPALRAFYDRLDKRGQTPDLLDLLCCTRAPEPAHEAPLSRIFGTRGSAVLRSAWEPDSTVITLRAGPWFNHEHHDQGSFQVAAFGTRLISEAGYANYYLDPNYSAYFTQAPGHNTVLVDDDAFSQADYDGPFWSALQKYATFTDHLLSSGLDYIAAAMAPAYGSRVSGYERQYLFLAPDVLIVRDDLRAAQPHVFTWLLHAAEGAAVDAQGSRATIRVGDAEADVTAGGASAAWELRKMPLPASILQYSGNVLQHPNGDREAPQRYALRLSAPSAANARFEVAMQFRRHSAAGSELQPIEISNASGFSGGTSDVWALFRKAPGELRFHGLTSDGAVFAGRGGENWIAIGMRSVGEGGGPLLTASTAVNAAWSRSAEGIMLNLYLNAPTAITVRAAGTIASVSVDGVASRYRTRNGNLELSSLPKGEHRVWISTRAAL